MIPPRASILLVAALAALAIGLRPACAPEAERVMRIAPGIEPEMARHLVRDDEATFRSYCRSIGTFDVKVAMARLQAGMDLRSNESYARSWAAAAPYVRRLTEALASEFDCPDYLRAYQVRERLPAESRWEIALLWRESDSLETGHRTLSPQERMERYRRIRARYAALGYTRGVMLTEAAMAREIMRIGGLAERMGLLRSALAHARSIDDRFITCQILGELGASHLRANQEDSARVCYEEARRIAMRCRFPDQAGRILSFFATYHLRRGRVALAMDLVHESQRICREFGGGGWELRFVSSAMTMFAGLECWEAVGRLLDRSAVLLREVERTMPAKQLDLFRLTVERHRARMLLARGEVDQGERILRRIDPDVRRVMPRVGYAELHEEWSAGLMDAARWERALPVIERGLAYSDSENVPEVAQPLALEHAMVLEALGRHAEARRALADFDRRRERPSRPEPQLTIPRDVVEARLLAAAGDRPGARALVRRALAAMREHARGQDASAQSHLTLGPFETLRLAAHEILATDPASGYRLEMEWRGIARELGRATGPDPAAGGAARASAAPGPPVRNRGAAQASAPPGPPARDRAAALPATLPPPGVIHCVYLPLEHATIRWTATSSGVERDTLPLSRERARERVRELLERIAEDAGDERAEVPAGLAAELRALAALLLPGEVLRESPADPVRTFCVSADGPLAALPFEALDLSGPGEYQPLASRWDVARIHSLDVPRRRRAPGAPSVVADPAFPPTVRRRFAIDPRLDQARAEARLAASLWPGARMLSGAAARKPAVLAAWREAPRIHVAAHLVRPPELPALGFVPLAASGPEAAEDDFCLDPGDVRTLDLSGCELVVLSACASGAPDLSPRSVGPSLADAFLDAGAAAVVQTLRPVADDEAREFVTGFLRTTAAGGSDVVSALGRSRRLALSHGPGARRPAAWAAWSVGVLGYPRAAPAAGERAVAARARR